MKALTLIAALLLAVPTVAQQQTGHILEAPRDT
jgi:hypothetical protein